MQGIDMTRHIDADHLISRLQRRLQKHRRKMQTMHGGAETESLAGQIEELEEVIHRIKEEPTSYESQPRMIGPGY
jgi:hypothetical protein